MILERATQQRNIAAGPRRIAEGLATHHPNDHQTEDGIRDLRAFANQVEKV